MTAAAFTACYADWKLIKTRGVVQVVFELPLHNSDAAYQALGGMPEAAKERWFGIARLNTEEAAPVRGAVEEQIRGVPTEAAPRPQSNRLARQAAICCRDPVFQKYLQEHHSLKCMPDSFACADIVRRHCDVTTRKDIIVGTPAGAAWEKLFSKFTVWKLVPA